MGIIDAYSDDDFRGRVWIVMRLLQWKLFQLLIRGPIFKLKKSASFFLQSLSGIVRIRDEINGFVLSVVRCCFVVLSKSGLTSFFTTMT